MRFQFTPDEAQAIAEKMASELKADGFVIYPEWPISEGAPYRTTLLATKSGFVVLVEAQASVAYGEPLRRLAQHLAATRANCELRIATVLGSSVSVHTLSDLGRDGVGLVAVDTEGRVPSEMVRAARNPALMITPDPSLKYGPHRGRVHALVQQFNGGDRKGALRDMYELVEGLTDDLARAAARNGHVSVTESAVEKMSWSQQIDTLASPNQAAPGKAPLVPDSLKGDLHSFRGGRNILDHKARGKREEIKRQHQFGDRIMTGARLVAEITSIRRRAR